MIIEQVGVAHDINTVGWKYLTAWLNYFTENDNNAQSTLLSCYNDHEISRPISDLPPALSP